MLGGLSASTYCIAFGTLYGILFGAGLGQPLSLLLALSASYLSAVVMVPQRHDQQQDSQHTTHARTCVWAGVDAGVRVVQLGGGDHAEEAIATAGDGRGGGRDG